MGVEKESLALSHLAFDFPNDYANFSLTVWVTHHQEKQDERALIEASVGFRLGLQSGILSRGGIEGEIIRLNQDLVSDNQRGFTEDPEFNGPNHQKYINALLRAIFPANYADYVDLLWVRKPSLE